MVLVQLDDHLKLNIPEIDAQHAALIDLINHLHQAMLQEADRATLDEILSRLLKHAGNHFAYEERLMSQYDYPKFEAHKEEHRKLIERLQNLMDQYYEGKLLLSFAIMIELKAWATIHIEKSDKLLGVFLLEQKGNPA